MNDFSRITVCAVDCVSPKLAARALERSMKQCDFADALLLTDQAIDTRARAEKIGPIGSQTEYSRFMLRELGPYIRTDYVLVVQWDGFVLDASQWRSGFLDYDYIGAPWPVHDRFEVGNGGFSLRSRRLLDALADPAFPKRKSNLRISTSASPNAPGWRHTTAYALRRDLWLNTSRTSSSSMMAPHSASMGFSTCGAITAMKKFCRLSRSSQRPPSPVIRSTSSSTNRWREGSTNLLNAC